MTPDGKRSERPTDEGHAKLREMESEAEVKSHREIAHQVRGADRFALQLPAIGRVPIPRPDQVAFYGALAALVAAGLVEWPAAVVIGAGHALVTTRPEQAEAKPAITD